MIGPKEINQISKTSNLLELDLVPILLIGNKKTITVKDLINQIVEKLDKGEAYCLAVYARNLAELNKETAELALEKALEALALAKKAYDLAIQCGGGGSIDDDLYLQLLTLIHNLENKVNNNSTLILNILNSSIKASVASKTNEIIYKLYKGNTEFLSIIVPQYKAGNNIDITNNVISVTNLPEYIGSEHIEVNDRIISTKGLADVAYSGSYLDLSNRPTKLSDFNIDVDFVNEGDLVNIDNRITNLELCCEEIHRRPNKLINKLIECENPFFDYQGRLKLLKYDVFIDINTVNDTEYVIPEEDTWDDVILPNSNHTISIYIASPYWGKDLTLHNSNESVIMSEKRVDGGKMYEARLTNIRGNVILTGKIFNADDNNSIINILDYETKEELSSGIQDIDLIPGQSLLRSDGMDMLVSPMNGYIFTENAQIVELSPNTSWANVQYIGPSLLSLEVTEAPQEGTLLIGGLLLKEEPEQTYLNVNIKKIGLGTGTVTSEQGDSVEFDLMYEATITPNSDSTVGTITVTDLEGLSVPFTTNTSGNNVELSVDTVHTDLLITVEFNLISPMYYNVLLDSSLGESTVTPTTILENKQLVATVTPPEGYTLIITLAKIGGSKVTSAISGNTITIGGKYITGDVTIYGSLTKIPTEVTVTNNVANSYFTILNLDYLKPTTIPMNKPVTIKVTPNTGYEFDGNITINHGGNKLTANASNNYTVSIANVTNSITITGETKQSSYSIGVTTNFGKAVNNISPTSVNSNSNVEITISPKSGYTLTKITNVTEGGYPITNDSRVNITKVGDNYKITINNVLGNIVIDGTYIMTKYSIKLKGELADGGTILPGLGTYIENNVCYISGGSNGEITIINQKGVDITSVTSGILYDITLNNNDLSKAIVQFTNVTKNIEITGNTYIRISNERGKPDYWFENVPIGSESLVGVGNNIDVYFIDEDDTDYAKISQSKGSASDSHWSVRRAWESADHSFMRFECVPNTLNLSYEKLVNSKFTVSYRGATAEIPNITHNKYLSTYNIFRHYLMYDKDSGEAAIYSSKDSSKFIKLSGTNYSFSATEFETNLYNKAFPTGEKSIIFAYGTAVYCDGDRVPYLNKVTKKASDSSVFVDSSALIGDVGLSLEVSSGTTHFSKTFTNSDVQSYLDKVGSIEGTWFTLDYYVYNQEYDPYKYIGYKGESINYDSSYTQYRSGDTLFQRTYGQIRFELTIKESSDSSPITIKIGPKGGTEENGALKTITITK